ncbi:peptidyl-prolyl cis-trans isomerase B (cyclophilin B) [Muricomes intestini]|uniref:peptidylprolyl isomerase n=2 Tax=Muricomes intestini TaxID=1796634 RepID=A0A4R3KD00_9FIRM|nr:peptidylprolyl isomerase [Muricomes intestini]TCS81116.1 peptidyl-prolyl cis-trans isomerase B (cyclophilin B) [Muricomes intestini]
MNPKAAIYMDSGNKIVIELLPDAAPNTVNSFIYAAQKGAFDQHMIERIVPEDWIDVSYSGFGKEEFQYLIPYEHNLYPEIQPLDSQFGCVCMGGYGKLGQSGCEFFFPLRKCPEHKGIYPVFGRVLEGHEELERLKKLDLEPVTNFPYPGVKVNRPVTPQKIVKVELELYRREFPEPIRLQIDERPKCWNQC